MRTVWVQKKIVGKCGKYFPTISCLSLFTSLRQQLRRAAVRRGVDIVCRKVSACVQLAIIAGEHARRPCPKPRRLWADIIADVFVFTNCIVVKIEYLFDLDAKLILFSFTAKCFRKKSCRPFIHSCKE